MAQGCVPCFVCATVGTTGTTAVDPVPGIAEVLDGFTDKAGTGLASSTATCSRPWLHIDAAHAGAAAICPEFRWLVAGSDRADSFAFNPHKWLLTNFDCDCFYVRDRRTLVDALSITPDYLRNAASESGRVVDFRDWQIPLGRRFRALKLWFVMRAFGLQGLREHVREHVRLGALFESLVRADARFEIVAPRILSLVCFRLRSGDQPTRALMEKLNASGRLYLTHTTLPPDGRTCLRMAIGAVETRERHVLQAWEELRAAAS
jgi:aromatic-L-amino-acid decarboxylase